MKTCEKTLDCLALKDGIQADLNEECTRLGEDEVYRRHQTWLETSTDPLAVWWRDAAEHDSPSAESSLD